MKLFRKNAIVKCDFNEETNKVDLVLSDHTQVGQSMLHFETWCKLEDLKKIRSNLLLLAASSRSHHLRRRLSHRYSVIRSKIPVRSSLGRVYCWRDTQKLQRHLHGMSLTFQVFTRRKEFLSGAILHSPYIFRQAKVLVLKTSNLEYNVKVKASFSTKL